MTSVSQVEMSLKHILEERANVLARETGCIQRQRKFSGADLLQTLVFGWLTHPEISLEMLASTAATRRVQVTDTAVHKRFSKSCAQFLHAVLEEMTSMIVEADREVPFELLRRFETVVLEDSSSIALPEKLAKQWQGCGGTSAEGQAAVKLHVRFDLKRGQLHGPKLTHGRVSDRSSPFLEDALPAGSLYIADLGYLDWGRIATRRVAGSYTVTRAQARTRYWTPEGKPLKLDTLLPHQVGQTKERWVCVGEEHRYLMRLLIVRVPEEVAQKRRTDLEADAKRRGHPVRQRAWELAAWTILLTDAPADLLSLQEALVLLRERWQMEMLYKLWKQYAQIDEWHTANPWRILCELYAKLIGVLLQHWLIVLFAWQEEQRSLVKLAQVVRDTASSLLEALAGDRSLLSALQCIQRRMGSGCQMNTREKYPNAAQLLMHGSTNWVLSP
jgi:Transposase DDE domain